MLEREKSTYEKGNKYEIFIDTIISYLVKDIINCDMTFTRHDSRFGFNCDILGENTDSSIILLIECKNHSKPIGKGELDKFIKWVQDAKAQYEGMMYSAYITSGPYRNNYIETILSQVSEASRIVVEDLTLFRIPEKHFLDYVIAYRYSRRGIEELPIKLLDEKSNNLINNINEFRGLEAHSVYELYKVDGITHDLMIAASLDLIHKYQNGLVELNYLEQVIIYERLSNSFVHNGSPIDAGIFADKISRISKSGNLRSSLSVYYGVESMILNTIASYDRNPQKAKRPCNKEVNELYKTINSLKNSISKIQYVSALSFIGFWLCKYEDYEKGIKILKESMIIMEGKDAYMYCNSLIKLGEVAINLDEKNRFIENALEVVPDLSSLFKKIVVKAIKDLQE